MDVKPTFLTVMFVLMQYKTVAALTNVRADRVDALVLAAAVVLAALIFVCERHTCNTSLMWKQCGRRAIKEQATPTGRKQTVNMYTKLRCSHANVFTCGTATYSYLAKPLSSERVNIKREQLNPSTCPREISTAPWWQVADMKKKGNINTFNSLTPQRVKL